MEDVVLKNRTPARVVRLSLRGTGGLCVCALALLAGCKTSDDAAAVATQMATASKTLSDYYSALHTVFENTNQLYILNEAVYAKPYTQENHALLLSNEAELDKRAKLAGDLSDLAASFAKLTASAASANVADAGIKLQAECDTLAGVTASTTQQNVLKMGLQLFVTAVQEHKEREAARAMDDLARGLYDLFVKEEPVWNSTEIVYAQIAATLAKQLVDQNGVDNSGTLKVALDPFGLTPALPRGDLNISLRSVAKQQIDSRQAALNAGYVKATDAMAKCLHEMSDRIHLVATEKPMTIRSLPDALATVKAWADKVG